MKEEQFFEGLRRKLEWPEFGPDADLAASDRWDSLAHLIVVMYVQEELGQTLAAAQLGDVTTGRELASLVRGEFD